MHWLGPYVIKETIDGGEVKLVELNGEPFPGKVNVIQLKPYTGDPSRLLYEGRIVLVLRATKRRHMIINYSTQFRELHGMRRCHRVHTSM